MCQETLLRGSGDGCSVRPGGRGSEAVFFFAIFDVLECSRIWHLWLPSRRGEFVVPDDAGGCRGFLLPCGALAFDDWNDLRTSIFGKARPTELSWYGPVRPVFGGLAVSPLIPAAMRVGAWIEELNFEPRGNSVDQTGAKR